MVYYSVLCRLIKCKFSRKAMFSFRSMSKCSFSPLTSKICQSKKAIHKSSVHNQIETAADTYLLTEHGGVFDVSQFNSADTITNKIEVIDEISHLLAFVVPKVTGKFIDEKDVATAIADTRRMQKILQDKRGALRPVCVAIETIFAPIIKFFKFSSMIKPRDLEKAKKYGRGTFYRQTDENDLQRSFVF